MSVETYAGDRWLGLVWNTEINKLLVSYPRIQKLKGNIQNILEGYTAGFKWFEVRSIASVVEHE